MKIFQPEEVIVERGSDSSPMVNHLRRALPGAVFRTVDSVAAGNGASAVASSSFGAAKKKLIVTRQRGEFLKKCPGSDGQVCCNYFVINFASNCPMDCSYCYLQEYLAENSALKVFSNVDDLLVEADELLSKHRRYFFRIGTGEITDSLALEPYIGFAREVVPFFAEQPNVLLELKTKSDCVDGLLDLDPKDRVVVPLVRWTARVLLELADESNGDRDLEPWRNLQRWLADAEHRVTIPYARELAQQIAPIAVRLRRDFGSVLALIRSHAVLHQASRARDDEGRIIATLDDYTIVRDLVADTIAEGVGSTVSDTVRETVDAVEKLASVEGVMARAVADELRLDKSNVSRRLRVAADGGYIRNLEDKRGRPGRWVIGDPMPESVELLPQLATVDTTPDVRGCAVALRSTEENTDSSLNDQHAKVQTFVPPTGLGRCGVCGWDIATQGHRPDCTANSDEII